MIKIISGGQTGVDRAALDVAILLNIPHGGWCPKGRLSEEGPISKNYLLQETDSENYSIRTKMNIRDSDGTLIILPAEYTKITDGTILTMEEVKNLNKSYLIIFIENFSKFETIVDWIKANNIHILNVAGPRESQSPGIYQASYQLLKRILSHYAHNRHPEISIDHSECLIPFPRSKL